MKDPIGFLRRQQEADTGDAAERWQRMETFYNRRLWHQLTVELLEFTLIPCFPSGDNLLQLYENFISDFEHRINPLSLVEIILRVVRQMNDAQMALSLLEKTWEKVKDNDEALILCRTAIAAIKIKIGDLQETKWAHSSREHLPWAWLHYWGMGFTTLVNCGNVETFFSLKTNWGSQSDLANNEQRLKEKLQLLCLMEMVFTRPANHRQMTFQEISHQAKVPVDEVEMLVMKALSAGLVKGSIDEVDHKVHMTWVQPRVMDLQQVSFMKQRLEAWCADVKNISILVEDHAHEVLG
ncbi:26S proteasome non-ATPase regulatory subunit 13-like isoform X4 [Amblyraja radiata]|uniref:26S proteasome non-ATPase regulatory subunit 13-like isoform X4 n=1 Tax=Amblyraja radiata TaxID=386614 RepID=UPI0014029ED6|nr:26S proteasome non-ATPase regulatory subunit 13-like isoform X4 [Amblyraja radiata]